MTLLSGNLERNSAAAKAALVGVAASEWPSRRRRQIAGTSCQASGTAPG